MRVFGRTLVLGFMLTVCAPTGAAAETIAINPDDPCSLLPTLNCTSMELFDALSTTARWDGTFADEGDNIFLFSFSLEEATRLLVTTDSWAAQNFDPTLGLFYADGSIVTLSDDTLARFFDIDPNGEFTGALNFDDHIDVELAGGEYLLALVFGSLHESLATGFDCASGCGLDGASAFGFDATLVNQTVPEPGTLALMVGGAAAGLVHRRRTRKRQDHSSSVSR